MPGGPGDHGRRRLTVSRLRPRLVVTFSVVAAVSAVSVAATSYVLVRRATLHRATTSAVRQGRAALDDAVDRLPPSPGRAEVRDLASRIRARSGFDVVAVEDDGSFESTSISLSPASVPPALRAPVAAGRVSWERVGSGRSARVVVGGRVPDGPVLWLYFPLADLAADLDLVRNVLAAVGAALVLASGVVGAVAARRLLRPLREARGAASRLEVGLLQTRLPETGGDEFADLAHSFNRMADALEASVADLSALEASHRRFVSDVAHELRTPLTALTTSADVLEAHAGGLDDRGRRAAHLLVVESRRLAALVEDLMEVSRLDAGVAPMRWEPVDLAATVVGALDLRGWMERVRVQPGPGGIEARTWGDRRRLDSVVANLVGNALEHGSPPVTVTVGGDSSFVTVAVADAGPGIAPEHLAHVFDRFYKADPSRARPAGGRGAAADGAGGGSSGLGLAIAQENARLHGGDVTVASSAAEGTTFTVVLPRRRDPPPTSGDAPTPSVARSLPGGDEAVTTARFTAIDGPRRRKR
ncbi:MAG: ATP-binding protein [Acidimicrobiales bacterium]